jgi:hypothetical protein
VSAITGFWQPPRTEAVRRALRTAHDETLVSDLLFLEAWEMRNSLDLAATLRASQIRRANPRLAEEVRAELRATRAQEHERQRRNARIATLLGRAVAKPVF